MSKVRYSSAFFDSMNEYSGTGERLSGRVGQFVLTTLMNTRTDRLTEFRQLKKQKAP